MTAIVQINFTYAEPDAEFRAAAQAAAPKFAGLDGLAWKIWLIDEERKEAGGIYFFRTRAKAEAYVGGDIVAGLREARPDVVVKVFDNLEEVSAHTGGFAY